MEQVHATDCGAIECSSIYVFSKFLAELAVLKSARRGGSSEDS
jgi:hypothetical protein